MGTLNERIEAGEVIILDGAIGTELERRGAPMNTEAWCARVTQDTPDLVRELHEDYIRAGADVITVNTFSAARHVLEAAGLGDAVAEINTRAVELAREARDRVAADRNIAVAGSISTYVSGNSGFQDPQGKPPPEQARAVFREQAELLAEAGVDLFVMELLMDWEMASAAMEEAVATGLPVWVGFGCRMASDGETVLMHNRGTDIPFADLIDRIMNIGGSVAGVMHTKVDVISPALEVVFEHWSGPVCVYAESGEFITPNWQFDDIITPEDHAEEAAAWVESGVQIVGGCCGINPEHIAALKQRLPSHAGTPRRA